MADKIRFKVASNSECVCFNIPVGDRPACNVKVHVHRWMDKSPVALLLTVYIGHVKYLPTALRDKSMLTISAAQQFCTYQQRCKTSVYLPTALQGKSVLATGPRSVVVSTLECGSEGLGFESYQSQCWIFQPWPAPTQSWECFGNSGKAGTTQPSFTYFADASLRVLL